MKSYNLLSSREEAENLLTWAYGQNPGPWAEHSRTVARAAETIAKAGGLDADRAYISGLLHDIGRYEGVRGLHHIYAGYELLKEKGYETVAEICLTHSFPYQNTGEYMGENDCTPEELSVITSFLSEKIYNDYDKLIQLCDALGSAQGVCLIEKRLLDVVRRYGFNDFTLRKWDLIFLVKEYFEKLCGKNIYDLFYDEIRTVSFM